MRRSQIVRLKFSSGIKEFSQARIGVEFFCIKFELNLTIYAYTSSNLSIFNIYIVNKFDELSNHYLTESL